MDNYKMRISVCDAYDPRLRKEENNSRVSNGWNVKEIEWAEEPVRNTTTLNGLSCNEYSSDHRTTSM